MYERSGRTNPKNDLMWSMYVDPASPTFGTARASAIAAGWNVSTASSVTDEPWFLQRCAQSKLVKTAEKVLQEMLETEDIEKVVFEGKEYNILRTSPGLRKIKQDTAKFVAERLAKQHYAAQSTLDMTSGGKALTKEDTANLLSKLACEGSEADDKATNPA